MARIAYAPLRRIPLSREHARRDVARAAAHTTIAADALGGIEPRLVRSHCKRCGARWAAVRVTVDFRTLPDADRLVTIECARCGRTFRRVAPDAYPVTARIGDATVQRVRLTLILPATAARWYSHGTWHRDGDDGLVLIDATLADADDATRAHRLRRDRGLIAKATAKARKAADDAAAIEKTATLLAALDARDAERAAEEAAAAAREAL